MSTLPILQEQFDTLLAFDASPNDLNNGIINSAFLLLFKDFVKLYIAYQSAINRLLELYFSVVQVKRAKELLDAYRKFLVRMDKVNDFISVVDSVGLDKSLMPNLSRAPTSMSLKVLEKHVEFLESNGCKSRASVVALDRINAGCSSSLRRQSSSTIELPDYIRSILATPNRASPSPGHNGYGLLARSGSVHNQQQPQEQHQRLGQIATTRQRQRQRSLQSTPMRQHEAPLQTAAAAAPMASPNNYENPLCADLLSPLAVARLTCYKQKKDQQRKLNELSRLDAQFEALLEREGETGNQGASEAPKCDTVAAAAADDDDDNDNYDDCNGNEPNQDDEDDGNERRAGACRTTPACNSKPNECGAGQDHQIASNEGNKSGGGGGGGGGNNNSDGHEPPFVVA